MADKLGELLIKRNLLNQAQLEEALQAQVIFGGKLGTILIEMGLITEHALAEMLTLLLGVPCVKPGELQKIPENVINLISQDLAEKHQVIPVSVSGKKLTLAMSDPHHLKVIDELSFRTGFIIVPVLALEVRMVFALEKYYNIKRTMRYIAPPKQVRDELNQLPSAQAPKAAVKAPKTAVKAPEVEEDLGIPGSEHIFHKQKMKKAAVPEDVEEVIEVVEELSNEDLIEELEDEEITLATTAQALVNIADRNDVADAVIQYLGANYKRAALFMVVAGQVTGWRSVRDGQPIPGFDQFQLPISEPSVLKTAVESNSYVLGPVPPTGANLALTTFLGQPAPKSALLLPMSMLGRVVGLIYVDDPSADLSEAVIELRQVASKALMAFEILILQNKILRL